MFDLLIQCEELPETRAYLKLRRFVSAPPKMFFRRLLLLFLPRIELAPQFLAVH